MSSILTPAQIDWVSTLDEQIPHFLHTLERHGQLGHSAISAKGATATGAAAGLGFSCFALKTAYTLDIWRNLSLTMRNAWLNHIRSYQSVQRDWRSRPFVHPFIDPPIYGVVATALSLRRRLVAQWLWPTRRSDLGMLLIAETKQALATLAQVGAEAVYPFAGFPTVPTTVEFYLRSFDWSRPWAAGGQTAALPVFLRLCWSDPHDRRRQEAALETCRRFYARLADRDTGAYYVGHVPDHGELINGAMKVLTALDWLETPIHYPERLIDTCLARMPAPEGCHLVDAVYVLYRCLQETDHRRAAVEHYLCKVLEMIRLHHNRDGGFSYNVGRAQTYYYGATISHGLAESDVHGTCLLTWALAMIGQVIPDLGLDWLVIKP